MDYVVFFKEKSVLPLIRKIRPDVLAKGADYAKTGVVGADFVETYGGEVARINVEMGKSTSGVVERILERYERQ